MKGFLQRFWASAVSLAGVAGLYLAAIAVHLLVWFWAVVAIAALVGIVPVLVQKGYTIGQRLRSYDVLLKRSAKAELELATIREELTSTKALATERWEAGVSEGRAQVLGSFLSQATPTPRIVGQPYFDI